MVKDVLAITATIVILAVGTASAFWEVVFFGHTITGARTVAPKPEATKERAAAKTTGTVKAIDKEERTVTLVDSPGGTLTLAVQDPQTLDAARVGDLVVATYYEALVVQVRPAGAAKPGDMAAGPIESQVTLTAAVAAVDGKNGMLTIKGLEGDAETVKVGDPKILTGIKAGDLVQLTFTPALAVALEKRAGM